jgi:hypothetical protein
MDFVEGYQQFSFDDDRWVVFKYDDETAYRKRIGELSGTKAVDFVGMHNGDLFLIEVKDFRNHRIENQARLTSGDLAIESGQKIRDTVAGIIGAYRTSDPQKWSEFARSMTDSRKAIRVVVWLEYDLPEKYIQREKVRASVETAIYKQKLSWLTSRVLVTNQANNGVPDLVVRNLPHLQQP